MEFMNAFVSAEFSNMRSFLQSISVSPDVQYYNVRF